MKTSKNGLELIKHFEGCRLTAYKPVQTEKYYTIGYGHYSADIKPNQKITQKEADKLLQQDLERFEKAVESMHYDLSQNEFDALVSFTYNCGEANLKRLTENRNKYQIADGLLLYNKAGGKYMAGLARRRTMERELFIKK